MVDDCQFMLPWRYYFYSYFALFWWAWPQDDTQQPRCLFWKQNSSIALCKMNANIYSQFYWSKRSLNLIFTTLDYIKVQTLLKRSSSNVFFYFTSSNLFRYVCVYLLRLIIALINQINDWIDKLYFVLTRIEEKLE